MMTRIFRAFVEGIKFFRENRDYSFKVAAEFIRTKDPEAVNAVLDSPSRLQEKPYVPMKESNFFSESKRSQSARPAFRSRLPRRFKPDAGVGKNRLHRRALEELEL
jgi:hypothetical protein